LFGTAGRKNNISASQTVRAVVVESDITTTQKRIRRYNSAAEL
jgi:hypothetical protein